MIFSVYINLYKMLHIEIREMCPILPSCANDVLPPDLALPDKPISLLLGNIGSLITLPSKLDTTSALKPFSALKIT